MPTHAPAIPDVDRLAYRPVEAARVSGLSRTTIYEAIASGRLPARKLGARTIVLRDDLAEWLAALPSAGDPDLSAEMADRGRRGRAVQLAAPEAVASDV